MTLSKEEADLLIAKQTLKKAINKQAQITENILLCRQAQDDFHLFCKLIMVDPKYPDDYEKTLYEDTPQAKLFRRVIEDMQVGKEKRVAISIPPQSGKTLHFCYLGLAWLWAKDPTRKIVVAAYNANRASDYGRAFKVLLRYNRRFKKIFPDLKLHTDNVNEFGSEEGGNVYFIGLGGAITGRTAHFFIVDDPHKGDEDDPSDRNLEKIYSWFFSVAYSRGSDTTRICVIHTRWYEDDLIGRLCDPEHPERHRRYAGVADSWNYLHLPGVIKAPAMAKALGLELKVPTDPFIKSQFGSKPMTSLWPSNKSLKFYAEQKAGNPRAFNALVMGRPAPEGGQYFKEEWIKTYSSKNDIPKALTIYGASDHAVSTRAERDFTVLMCVGVDIEDDIWILPDLLIERMDTRETVNQIVRMIGLYRPKMWWMENELISKSFGPFLKEEMRRRNYYETLVMGMIPSRDKATRARAIQGRMSMGTIHFPSFAPWFEDAKGQLLRFPYGAHDDFVDCLAWVGQGLQKIVVPSPDALPRRKIETGTFDWLLEQTDRRNMQVAAMTGKRHASYRERLHGTI